MSPVRFNQKAWNQMVSHVLDTDGVARMSRVADACNSADDTDEYKLSVEGVAPLRKRDYRVTVITAGGIAARRNAVNNTLVANFYLAGGD